MQGAGIAAAKALIEATVDAGGLSFKRRGDVRMYYRVCGRWPIAAAVACNAPRSRMSCYGPIAAEPTDQLVLAPVRPCAAARHCG